MWRTTNHDQGRGRDHAAVPLVRGRDWSMVVAKKGLGCTPNTRPGCGKTIAPWS